MNKEQLTLYRLHLRIQVRDSLLHRLRRAPERSGAASQALLVAICHQMLEEADHATYRGVDAAQSDMLAAEYRDAVQQLIQQLQV